MNIFYTDYANKTDSFGDCTIENCAGDCSALRGWFDILGNTLIHFLAEFDEKIDATLKSVQ